MTFKSRARATVSLLGILGAVAPSAFAPAALAQDLPPNAQPGHCYGKMLIPEEYQTYTEQVVERPARSETRITPAVMREQEQRIVDVDAHVELRTVPATYKTITETVVVKPQTTRKVNTPAVYGEVTEQVMVREAHTVWKRGAVGPGETIVTGSNKVLATGEVLCLVLVPAEYKTVTRQVVRTPESTRDVVEEAVTRTVTRQVVDQPARVVEERIPATYKTVRVAVVATPERTETIEIPAVLRTVTKQKLVTQSHFEWREVDCQPESGPTSVAGLGLSAPTAAAAPAPAPGAPYRRVTTQTTATSMSTSTSTATSVSTPVRGPLAPGGDRVTQSLQMALQSRGYFNSRANGRFTNETQAAMMRFQRASGLVVGDYNRETARALGL